MFTPNAQGLIARTIGYDLHGRETFGPTRVCPCGIVSLSTGSQKTSVRADSSASRGAADEIAAQKARILIPSFVSVGIGDRFTFEGQKFRISAVHPRRSVIGDLDHFECDLELMPDGS